MSQFASEGSADAPGKGRGQGNGQDNGKGRNTTTEIQEIVLASYAYNALGERVTKAAADTATRYVYGLNGELLAERAEGVVKAEYIWLNGEPFAYLLPADGNASSGTSLHYVHTDHLGTPQALSNEAGEVVWRAVYDPFGAAETDVDADGDGVGVVFNVRFPGQYWDAESGLHQNWHRYYDPKTGRYLTSDLIGLAGGLNTYAYVAKNPLRFIDPFGLAYFAKRPLAGSSWLGLYSCNPLYDFFNVEISHEQLFFEDGNNPSNIGFFDDGTLKTESNPTGYRCRSGKFNDCIMRKAVANTGPLPSYCIIGRNCQTWATRVRAEYARLAQDPQVQKECSGCRK